jgi:hypothetical protein
MVLVLRSGRRVTFERAADAFEPARLLQIVMTATGAQLPPYGRGDVLHLAGSMIRLSDLLAEDDLRSEAADWGRTFLAGAAPNAITATNLSTPQGRWEALSALMRRPMVESYAPACERSALVVCGETGARMLRTSDFAAHARGSAGRPLSWPALHGRMVEVGWEHPGEVHQRQPGGHERLKAHVYLVAAGWEAE